MRSDTLPIMVGLMNLFILLSSRENQAADCSGGRRFPFLAPFFLCIPPRRADARKSSRDSRLFCGPGSVSNSMKVLKRALAPLKMVLTSLTVRSRVIDPRERRSCPSRRLETAE